MGRPRAVQKAQGAYGIHWRRLFRPGITGWVASNRARKVELLQVYGTGWEAYCYISDVILSLGTRPSGASSNLSRPWNLPVWPVPSG